MFSITKGRRNTARLHRAVRSILHNGSNNCRILSKDTSWNDNSWYLFIYFIGTTVSDSNLVARVIKKLQPLCDILAGAEQVEQLLVVDLQQGDFDGELSAVLRKLLKDLVQRSGDDAGQRVLTTQRKCYQQSTNWIHSVFIPALLR